MERLQKISYYRWSQWQCLTCLGGVIGWLVKVQCYDVDFLRGMLPYIDSLTRTSLRILTEPSEVILIDLFNGMKTINFKST